ncbi:hypothetical protein LJC63_05860 [Ruminococcaceae bacterium OttesenSCG-928-L11]|nr:hypothetical protein [Ruminococcaceae bacterium OttesenSCG-928-L11]
MTIMAVDNYCQRLEDFARCLRESYPDDTIVYFADPFRAVQYINRHPVSIVFVDLELRPFDAFKFAELAMKFCGSTKVCIITDNIENCEYIAMECDSNIFGSLARPVSEEGLRQIVV